MGVDTHGVIFPEVTTEEIYAYIVKSLDPDAKFYKDSQAHNDIHKDWAEISFNYNGEKRYLYCGIFKRYEDDKYAPIGASVGEWYTYLSFGCWGKSVETMRSIISNFGGWIDDNDCDEVGFYPIPATENGEPIKIFRVTRKELNERYGGIVIIVD